MIEYEKYQELQSKSQKMQEDYERQLAETEESKEQALEELTEYYETKLQEKTTLLEQVRDAGSDRPAPRAPRTGVLVVYSWCSCGALVVWE